MKRMIPTAILMLFCCLASGQPSKEPTKEPAKTVTVDPLVTKLETVQKDLDESRKLVAALQRRLKAVDGERLQAQDRIVILTDELLRLTEELEAVRKGK